MQQRRWRGVLLALLLSLLIIPSSLAQSNRVIVDDNGVDIDKARVSTAANQLADKGALVVVITTNDGGGGNTTYLDRRLNELNIASNSSASNRPNNVIIYYVSMSNPRYSAILPGSQFNSALATNNQSDTIRNNQLNAGLRANDPTKGLVDALTATANVVSNPVDAANSTSSSSSSSGFNFLPLLIGIIAVGAGLFFLPKMLKKRSEGAATADALTAARGRYDAAKRAVGIAIADVGRQVQESAEKQRFDKISYPASQVQDLERRQRDIDAKFRDLQLQFDGINERIDMNPNPTVTDFDGAAGGYDGVRTQVEQIGRTLSEMDALRKQFDTIAMQAPSEVDRAKK